MSDTLVVEGLDQLLRGLKVVPPELEKELREGLREGGRIVEREAARRFGPFSKKTAAGFRTYVRRGVVIVEQSLRRTTGRHPEWGALQMRKGLLPARQAKLGEVVTVIEVRVGGLLRRNGLS